jgi:thiol-disulfide isomerase/thioredoxin
MNRSIRLAGVGIAMTLIYFSAMPAALGRTWTDATGKHTTEAELISATQTEVHLRLADGTERTIPLKRLSVADRTFVRKHLAGDAEATESVSKPFSKDKAIADEKGASEAVRQVAEKFYQDLRTKERDKAKATLTDAGQAVAKKGKSPLAQIGSPDESPKAIKQGRVKVDGTQAEVPVQIRAEGVYHKTTLHLRLEKDEWRVFAISASLGDDERTLDFESEAVDPTKEPDPLQALVGQKIRLEGLTLDGVPIDLSRFEGKVVLIDFWATWCGPCRKEMPNILANWQQYHESGFEVIAVSVDKDLGELQKFLVQENPPWTVLADRHPQNRTSMAAAYGIRGIPAFILVGKDGKVAAVNCRGKRLGEQLAKLLGS